MVLTLIQAMSEVAVMLVGMLVFGIIIRGGWWLMNWRARHPRPILPGNGVGIASDVAGNIEKKADLPVFFRMSTTLQVILYVLLLSPPLAATILIMDEWVGGFDSVFEVLVGFLHPANLFLTAIIYLLCPNTAWNIYWRRRDFISFDHGEIRYRSGFKSGELIPARISMFRGRSWKFDLTDLFRGQLATSWFLEIIPKPGPVKNGGTWEAEPVILDLKAMNLGGSALSIAKLASQIYGDKFVINNELPAPVG